jgi:phospholipid/cholesterol/gamma-HCH transport system ATP-binding protein
MIELVNICKSFDTHKVLDNLNLSINKGETHVIIGRSGCGKSVLLKHIIGLLKPDSGQIFIDNQETTRLSGEDLAAVRMKIGMLFQGAALFDSLTVLENVGFALMQHTDTGDEEIRKRVTESLELVGLRGIEDVLPSELSGGMKKRVGLARAICMCPEIILFDEPTTGVDPITGAAINELIKELRQRMEITSVAVTHDMSSAYTIADKISMLYQGKIIETGTPEEIRNSENPVIQQFITGAAYGPITHHERKEEDAFLKICQYRKKK